MVIAVCAVVACTKPLTPIEVAYVAQQRMPRYSGVTRCAPQQSRRAAAHFELAAFPAGRIEGDVSSDQIDRKIRARALELRACYAVAKARDPELVGMIATMFEVRPDGRVARAEVAGLAPDFDACLCRVLASLELGELGAPAVVHYPLVFGN